MDTGSINSRATGSGANSPNQRSNATTNVPNGANASAPDQHIDPESGQEGESDADGRSHAPLQKRRRVTRACDEVGQQKFLVQHSLMIV